MRWQAIQVVKVAAAGSVLAAAALAGTATAQAGPHGTRSPVLAERLYGVAATSPTNAWAVGISSTQGVITRWNGTAWKTVYHKPGPVPRDVAATSASNAWTVGGTSWWHSQPWILRWNGQAWKLAPTPATKRDSELKGVAATSARNAWAVGVFGGSPGFGAEAGSKTLILHWNGHAWKRVPSPTPLHAGSLSAVTAISATNAWAVGWTGAGPDDRGLPTIPLILHWNGRSWTRAAVPVPAGVRTKLNGVSAVSARNVWAAGDTNLYGANRGFVVHWNGRTWARVAHPNPAPGATFNAMTAISASDIWIVGETQFRHDCPGKCENVTEHWNGRAWTIVPSPNPQGDLNVLLDVAGTSSRDAWAVGTTDWATMTILRWNGKAWAVW